MQILSIIWSSFPFWGGFFYFLFLRSFLLLFLTRCYFLFLTTIWRAIIIKQSSFISLLCFIFILYCTSLLFIILIIFVLFLIYKLVLISFANGTSISSKSTKTNINTMLWSNWPIRLQVMNTSSKYILTNQIAWFKLVSTTEMK